MTQRPFAVRGNDVCLAVTTDGAAVTGIVLNGSAQRAPDSGFERLVAEELFEYLHGQRTRFTFRYRAQGTAFQRQVWEALEAIPYGETRTYGDVARTIGKPNAARAVGQANHQNPIPLVIPCHRVVASGGKLGGFGGGTLLKRRLLDLEGVHS